MRQQNRFCPKCGNKLRPDSKFCSKCSHPVKDMASATEQIFLDSYPALAFEGLVKRIFEKAGWGRVEQLGGVADKGRDLIIHSQQGKIVVECKHHKNSIGRPVVQKLHSAVMSEGTNRGIIVSTGGFSDQAKEYARDLVRQGITIELTDLSKLTEIAQSGGIELINKAGTDLKLYTFPERGDDDLKNKFLGYIASFESKPIPARNLFKLRKENVAYAPVYKSTVSINEKFYNSNKKLIIHQIHNINGIHYFDSNGQMVVDNFAKYIDASNSTIVSKQADSGTEFRLDNKDIQSRIKQKLVESNTTTIQYQPNPRINRISRKECKPKESSIVIHDIDKILLPEYRFKLNILRNQYFCILLESKNKLNISRTDLFNCRICSGNTDKTAALICNSCGMIAHNSESKTKCSHLCEICGKTICKKCAYYISKYLVMKKIICEPCADQSQKKKSKLMK